MELSGKFESFLRNGGVNVEWYRKQLEVDVPRYIRLSDRLTDEDIAAIEMELDCVLTPTFVPNFYAIPLDKKISNLSYYEKGLYLNL